MVCIHGSQLKCNITENVGICIYAYSDKYILSIRTCWKNLISFENSIIIIYVEMCKKLYGYWGGK
jgi:hypothetical protein